MSDGKVLCCGTGEGPAEETGPNASLTARPEAERIVRAIGAVEVPTRKGEPACGEGAEYACGEGATGVPPEPCL